MNRQLYLEMTQLYAPTTLGERAHKDFAVSAEYLPFSARVTARFRPLPGDRTFDRAHHARIETVSNMRAASAGSPSILAAFLASSLVIPLVKRRHAIS